MEAETRPQECDRPLARCACWTVEEAAVYTGFGLTYMQELVRSKRVPHIPTGAKGGRALIPKVALDEWLERTAWSNVAERESA